MYKEILYEIFLFIIVILKFVFIFTTIIYHTAGALQMNPDSITFLGKMKDGLFYVVDILINILLLILFNPYIKDIRINKEEKLLLFIYGILGFLQDVSKKY